MGKIKNILLTGVTGYLGSNLAKKLIRLNYNIIALKRQSSSTHRIETILNNIKLYDIENLDYDMLFVKEKIDIVIHTATSYGRKGEDIAEIFKANLFFPLLVLQSALKHGLSCFINSNTTLPRDLNLYTLSKSQFSDILKLKNNDINIIDVELQYFYGPGDDSSKFVSFIIDKLKSNASHIDLSPCTQVRDFVYIDDVIEAYILLIKNSAHFPKYKIVPVGSGNTVSLKLLTQKIKDNFSANTSNLNFGALPLREGEIMYSVADISFLAELGWKPEFTLDEGLKKTINVENSF